MPELLCQVRILLLNVEDAIVSIWVVKDIQEVGERHASFLRHDKLSVSDCVGVTIWRHRYRNLNVAYTCFSLWHKTIQNRWLNIKVQLDHARKLSTSIKLWNHWTTLLRFRQWLRRRNHWASPLPSRQRHLYLLPFMEYQDVFVKHGCPLRQQSQNLTKYLSPSFWSRIEGSDVTEGSVHEQTLDELKVQVWI